MENLESIYSHQERKNEAEQLQVQVTKMRKKPLDMEHPDTFKGMTKHTIFRKDEKQRKGGFKYKSWIRQRMVQETQRIVFNFRK